VGNIPEKEVIFEGGEEERKCGKISRGKRSRVGKRCLTWGGHVKFRQFRDQGEKGIYTLRKKKGGGEGHR